VAVRIAFGPADDIGAAWVRPVVVAKQFTGDRMMSRVKLCPVKSVVAAQQRRDAILKNLAEVKLIGQRESLSDTSGNGVSAIDDLHGMWHIVPIARV